MTWPVVWTPAAKADRLRIHYETMHIIVRAVERWAGTGEGFTEPVEGDLIRILAEGGSATVAVDEDAGVVVGLRLYADDPLPLVVPLLDEPDDGTDD
jgi:hypothetical protein